MRAHGTVYVRDQSATVDRRSSPGSLASAYAICTFARCSAFFSACFRLVLSRMNFHCCVDDVI